MRHFVSLCIFIFTLVVTTSAIAQESCASEVSVKCLNDVLIEHAEKLELEADRTRLYEVMVEQNLRLGYFETASEYFEKYGKDFSMFTINRVAEASQEIGESAKVKLAFDFRLAQQYKKNKPSNLLSIARDQLEFGLNDDARSTLQLAALLTQKFIKNGDNKLRELNNIAVLQRLYGWPGDVDQTLTCAEDDAKRIEKPMERAFVLADIAQQYHLAGLSDEGERILWDLILAVKAHEDKFEADQIQSAIVGTYVQLNMFKEADALNEEFSRTEDRYQDAVRDGVNILLTSENQYLLKIPSSTKERALKIIDKITDLEKVDFWYHSLIFKLAGFRQYDEALEIAELINNDDSKIEARILIAGFMAREEKDLTEPDKLIQQYAIELDNLSDEVLKSSEYPLSLIGGAYVDEEDFDHARPYLNAALRAKNLLQIDAIKTNDRTVRFWGLYHDYALMGEYGLLNEIYENSTSNEQKLELIGAMVNGFSKGGYLEYAVLAQNEFQRLIPNLSDEVEELDEAKRKFYPEGYIIPTERSKANESYISQNAIIASAFASNGDLIKARKYLELVEGSGKEIYVESAIIKALKSSGEQVEAGLMMQTMLQNVQDATDMKDSIAAFRTLYYLLDDTE